MALDRNALRELLKGLQDEYTEKLAEVEDLKRLIEKTRQYIDVQPMTFPTPDEETEQAENAPKVSTGRYASMSTPDAAKDVLATSGRAMKTAEIRRALEQGGIQSKAKNFNATLYTTLRRLQRSDEVEKVGTRWRAGPRLRSDG